MNEKRKRNVVTMEQKLNALTRLDRGEPVKRICDELCVGKSTVNDWRRNQKSIQDFCALVESEKMLSTRYTLKKSTNEWVDNALWLWFQQERRKGTIINGPLLKEKALMLHANFENGGNFSASDGWLYRWKKRHGVSFMDDVSSNSTVKSSISSSNLNDSDQNSFNIPIENQVNDLLDTDNLATATLVYKEPQTNNTDSTNASTYITPNDITKTISPIEEIIVKVEPPEEIEEHITSDNTIMNQIVEASSTSLNDLSNDDGSSQASSSTSHIICSERTLEDDDDSYNNSEDDDMHFLKSLLPDLKRLPRIQNRYVRLKIQELIYKHLYIAGCYSNS